MSDFLQKIKASITSMSEFFSDIVDDWRVFPRLVLIFCVWASHETLEWFFIQEDISTPQGLFIGAVWGATMAYMKFYVESRKNREDRRQKEESE
jgi:hypothetical protein